MAKKKHKVHKIAIYPHTKKRIKELSIILGYDHKSKEDIAELIDELIIGRLADNEQAIGLDEQFVPKTKAEWKKEIENEKEKERAELFAFAAINEIYDPVMEVLHDPELIRVHLMLKSTFKNSALEKLCKQYIGMYDSVDFPEFFKSINVQTKPEQSESTETDKSTEIVEGIAPISQENIKS